MASRRVVGISLTPEEFERLQALLEALPYVKPSKIALEAFRIGLPALEAKHLGKRTIAEPKRKAA